MYSSKSVYAQILPPLKDYQLTKNKEFDFQELKTYYAEWGSSAMHAAQKMEVFSHLKPSSKGELVLRYSKLYSKGAFSINVSDIIIVEASSEEGLFYGVLSLYKLFSQTRFLPYAKVLSEPKVQERSLHLDLGRKYFSKENIFKLLNDMAFAQLNTLQFHFSENKGFRIECETYPEIVSKEHLSKQDVLEIIDYASSRFIQIIPSLDSPGHLHYALQFFPQYQLPGSDGGSLDISNPEARKWIYNIYDEYAQLFQKSLYFNIGGDEFVDFERFDEFESLSDYAKNHLGLVEGKSVDTYYDYLNELSTRLEKQGFIVRAWNDGLYRKNQQASLSLKESIEIAYWTRYHKNMAELETFTKQGHGLINFHAENFYYVLHVDVGVKRIAPKQWFETWDPTIFSFDQKIEDLNQLIGASYSIWCDAPEIASQKRILFDIHEPLWAFASKLWSSKIKISYDQFKNIYVDYFI